MRVSIGFINYGVAGGYSNLRYLDAMVNSLKNQTFTDFEILCLDNNSTDGSLEIIRTRYPEIRITTSDHNTGFVGHNLLIQQATGDYYWCVNPDMFYAPDALAQLVHVLDSYPEYGSVGPLLYKWDFAHHTTTTIVDTAGVIMPRAHSPRERFVGQSYSTTNKDVEEVFALSGASVLFRMSALSSIQITSGEYFDNALYIYKEDVDLGYRLLWAGWKNGFVEKAIGWHDRTIQEKQSSSSLLLPLIMGLNRSHKSGFGKYYGVRNNLLVIYKNFSPHFSLRTWSTMLFFEFGKFVYTTLFETSNLRAYRDAYLMIKSGQIKPSPKTIAPSEIERLLS